MVINSLSDIHIMWWPHYNKSWVVFFSPPTIIETMNEWSRTNMLSLNDHKIKWRWNLSTPESFIHKTNNNYGNWIKEKKTEIHNGNKVPKHIHTHQKYYFFKCLFCCCFLFHTNTQTQELFHNKQTLSISHKTIARVNKQTNKQWPQ